MQVKVSKVSRCIPAQMHSRANLRRCIGDETTNLRRCIPAQSGIRLCEAHHVGMRRQTFADAIPRIMCFALRSCMTSLRLARPLAAFPSSLVAAFGATSPFRPLGRPTGLPARSNRPARARRTGHVKLRPLHGPDSSYQSPSSSTPLLYWRCTQTMSLRARRTCIRTCFLR